MALSGRLDSVRAMGDALRVQRHENANRLHAAVGLLDAGRVDEARAFLAELVDRGSVDWAVPGIELVDDVSKGLSYLVLADPDSTSSKADKARKLGVEVISEDQLLALLGRFNSNVD
jgi:hypothetical protein